MHDVMSATPQEFNRAYLDNFGIGILTVLNRTHVHWAEYDSATREAVDWLVVEKNWTRYKATILFEE